MLRKPGPWAAEPSWGGGGSEQASPRKGAFEARADVDSAPSTRQRGEKHPGKRNSICRIPEARGILWGVGQGRGHLRLADGKRLWGFGLYSKPPLSGRGRAQSSECIHAPLPHVSVHSI